MQIPKTAAASLLALTLSILLSACGGGTILGVDPAPNPGSGNTTAPFLPEPGAAVGSGNGTAQGTVRISPTAEEIEVIRLVNEVRTRGTLNGQDAITGSCVQGSFSAGTLGAVSYDGALAHAARMHSVYMSASGEYSHDETKTSHAAFYGASGADRINRSRQTFGMGAETGRVYENIVIRRNSATISVRDWMLSAPHCQAIMLPAQTRIGIGYAPPIDATSPTTFNSWTMLIGSN